MKNHIRLISALITGIVIGLICAACDGRVSGVWFALETAAMVLFTVIYFFGEGESGNTLESCLTSLILSFVPGTVWMIIVRSGSYFGYSGGKLIVGTSVCGLFIFLCVLLTRHEIGPLRAAFGRNMLPAFFFFSVMHRLIKYFKDLDSFTLSIKDDLCVHGLLFMIFAVGVMIGANRSKLACFETYIAVAVWGGVFTALHVLEFVNVPVLDILAA